MSKQDEKLLSIGVALDLDFTLINWNNINNLLAGLGIYKPIINQRHIRSEYRGTRNLPAHHLEDLGYSLPSTVQVSDVLKRTLHQLSEKRICTALITDSTLNAEHSSLFEYFDHIIITSRYGCSKPLSDSLYSLVAQTGIQMTSWIYIGDNPHLDGNFALSAGASYLDIESIELLHVFIG